MTTLPSEFAGLVMWALVPRDNPEPWAGVAGVGATEGWVRLTANLVTLAAALAATTVLAVIRTRRRDTTDPGVIWSLAAFILACGVVHAADMAGAWWPDGRGLAVVETGAAVLAAVTGVSLLAALPRGLAMPISRDHRQALAHMEALERENADLRSARTQLEHHSSATAVRERRLRDAVRSAKACAVLWEAQTGVVVWEAGYRDMLLEAGLERLPDVLTWEGLIGADGAATLTEACRGSARRGEVLHHRFALAGHAGVWDVRMTATPERPVAGQPPMMLGLLGLVPFGQSVAAPRSHP